MVCRPRTGFVRAYVCYSAGRSRDLSGDRDRAKTCVSGRVGRRNEQGAVLSEVMSGSSGTLPVPSVALSENVRSSYGRIGRSRRSLRDQCSLVVQRVAYEAADGFDGEGFFDYAPCTEQLCHIQEVLITRGAGHRDHFGI